MHYLSVMATFKNESMNLKEWLDHYIWQGVEHFYMIDNGSTDDYMSVLNEYKDIITLYNLPKRWAQVENYNIVFEQIKDKTFWLGVVDIDEFIYGVNEPVREYLDDREQYSGILCPWLLFGTCEDYHQPKSVRKGFTRRHPHHHHDYKCFSRTDKIKSLHIHAPIFTDNNQLPEREFLNHNHYTIQSREFWEKVKHTRGAADGQNMEHARTMDMFNQSAMNYGQYEDKVLHDMVVMLENGQNPYK